MEEVAGFAYGELEDLMDVETLVCDLEDLGLEAGAFAVFANQFDIGEELHFDGDGAVALAGFAATAGDVEGEVAGLVAALLGLGGGRKQVANLVEGFDVCDRVGAWRAADGRLVDENDIGEMVVACDGAAGLTLDFHGWRLVVGFSGSFLFG